MKRVIQAGKFKAECLKIMDDVRAKKYSIIIIKRNKPITKLIPLEKENSSLLFGKILFGLLSCALRDWNFHLTTNEGCITIRITYTNERNLQ